MAVSISNTESEANALHPSTTLPIGFVYVDDVIPSVILDMRYAGNDNFLGRPVAGYNRPACILSKVATLALAQIQKELLENNLSLKIFDCYRPQKAVDDFVAWRSQPSNSAMKAKWFPNIDKADIFNHGYILEKSGHSRGSTIDLTIVALSRAHPSTALLSLLDNNELDMGSLFDLFDLISHTDSNKINSQQRSNRLMLKELMQRYGFEGIPKEWWHFTLKDEPFKNQYFDFDVN